MKNKELLYFTGMCLTIDKHPDSLLKVKEQIGKNTVDWIKFVGLCSNHLITPAIYLKFINTNILSILPDELQFYLKEIYELNYSRNHLILGQVSEICDLLAENKIYPILLKGAGNLIDKLYSDPAERIMGDIDLLVTETEYLKAAQILIDYGYTESNLFYFDDVTTLKHYPRLSHQEKIASVEIHRLPVDDNYVKWLNQDIIRRTIKKAEEYPNCYVMSDEDKITLNFIHSQLTNKGHKSGVVPLRDVYDLFLLAEKVNLTDLLRKIIPYKKAGNYFFLSQRILGVNIGYLAKPTLSNKWLLFKHDLNFKSKAFYTVNKITTELYERLIIRYSGLIFKSFYSKKIRSFISKRLKEPLWYKTQLKSWKNMLKTRE
jgi:hypothetical protein